MEQKLEKQYRTLAKRAESEFTEKRSRFIGYCAPVSSEEQALEFIGEIKSMHRTASHNVWAYSLRQSNLMRFTDDKEPSGTAGLPVLDVIKRGEIEDAAIVVTRYFGGTLLGTGGLVRAYGEGASLAVRASGIAVMSPCRIYSLTCEYSEYDRIAQLLQKLGASVTDSEFTDSVSMTVALAQESGDRLCEEINELTRGMRKPEYIETKFEQTSVE
ncbi:MAG: YigZ family protein [Oscillospiraceae bacterium]